MIGGPVSSLQLASGRTRELTQKLRRIVDIWELSDGELSDMTALTVHDTVRLRADQHLIHEGSSTAKRALMLIAISDGINRLVGSGGGAPRRWLDQMNFKLGEPPIDLLRRLGGLARVYLHFEARSERRMGRRMRERQRAIPVSLPVLRSRRTRLLIRRSGPLPRRLLA